LHATLINTRHRVNEDEDVAPSHNNRNREPVRIPFSAEPILKEFSNIEFGTCRIESIQISKIGEYDEHGRYRSEGGIKLP